MSNRNPSQSTAGGQRQQEMTGTDSQEAMRAAFEFPLEQTVQLQKGAAQFFLNGLEIGTQAQRRGIELTKNAVTSYIDTMETTVRNTEQMTESGLQAMEDQQGMMQQQVQQGAQRPQGQQSRPQEERQYAQPGAQTNQQPPTQPPSMQPQSQQPQQRQPQGQQPPPMQQQSQQPQPQQSTQESQEQQPTRDPEETRPAEMVTQSR